MICRHCETPLNHNFIDLGFQPHSNAYLSKSDLSKAEITYPLRVMVCDQCWLVQTEDYTAAGEVFTKDYAYFSSTSKGWVSHAKLYCEKVIGRFNLNASSQIIEIASNDGYLLKNFVAAKIPCFGIEPTDSTADAAEKIGVPTIRQFFGTDLARFLLSEGSSADLIIGNNVFAHVPDINDFAKGLEITLKPEGVITLEFPHLMKLVELAQFDTIYHEHFSYLSLLAVTKVFEKSGLRIFDIDELPTHGGSIRIYACKIEANHAESNAVQAMIEMEKALGMDKMSFYQDIQSRAEKIKNSLIKFLIEMKDGGKSVSAYGAAAKGNTILNFAGIKPDLLPSVYDAAKAKQGKFMPGSHIPIYNPRALRQNRPDYILILPWNITAEIKRDLSDLAEKGTKFVTVVPKLEIF